MNNEKSVAYKKLVADMQKKYPVYTSKILTNFPKVIGKKGDPIAREVVRKFAATFSDKNDFYKTLKEFGLDWQENSKNNEAIYEMRAKEALRIAVENGFNPFDVVTKKDPPVELWAPVLNGENICQEINFYTDWQGVGYAEETPRIKYLLVAQDWGNLSLNQDFIDRIKKWNTGDRTPLYSQKPKGIGTDANLFELFKILGYDLSKRYDELFFTNFCLGYRSANAKIVGGMTKTLMMNDAEEFKRLCEILEPENILCLGRLTLESVYESLTGKNFNDIYKDAENYNDFLENHEEIFAQCGSIESKIFPLAHCGYMGSISRKKGLPKQVNPLHYQINDWKRILNSSKQITNVNEEQIMKKTALYGAILGDIIGSPFEFSKIRQKSKDFELFSNKSKFTDDTVMTIAVADAVLRTGNKKDGRILLKNVKDEMLYYGKKYPHAGYGGGFRKWLKSENPKPYNSLGNGSAMRVSAAGWIHNSIFDTRECARMTARPTHNHPEGVKGAMAVASAIFLARSNASKEEIKNYIAYEFGYNLFRNLDEVRENCVFDETCPVSAPEAIIAFLESENFEDAIRNAVSLGGDTDTQAAIAGSIAEAFYGVPEHLIKKCREYLPKEFLNIIDKFNFVKGYIADDLGNDSLEKKIEEFNKIPLEKNLQRIKQEIFEMLQKNSPMENNLKGFFAVLEHKNEIWQADTLENDGKNYDVLFTDVSEVVKRKNTSEHSQLVISDITEIFRVFEEISFDNETYGGLAINPYGENPLFLEKNVLKEISDRFNSEILGEKSYAENFV